MKLEVSWTRYLPVPRWAMLFATERDGRYELRVCYDSFQAEAAFRESGMNPESGKMASVLKAASSQHTADRPPDIVRGYAARMIVEALGLVVQAYGPNFKEADVAPGKQGLHVFVLPQHLKDGQAIVGITDKGHHLYVCPSRRQVLEALKAHEKAIPADEFDRCLQSLLKSPVAEDSDDQVVHLEGRPALIFTYILHGISRLKREAINLRQEDAKEDVEVLPHHI